MFKISQLHYITHDLPDYTHAELAEGACAAGINWIQLRIKNKFFSECLEIAYEVQKICKKYKAKLIINDNVDIAKRIRADGVHLGKTDMNPVEARNILGDNIIIGGTANTIEDIESLHKSQVNYIGLGPFRFTSTKENLSPILGLEGYKKIKKACEEKNLYLPLIAIGGIKPDDVEAIIQAGMYGVAVSSVISLANDKRTLVGNFNKILKETPLKQSIN